MSWSTTIPGSVSLTESLIFAYSRRLHEAGIRISLEHQGMRHSSVPGAFFGSRQVEEWYEAWSICATVDGQPVRLTAGSRLEAIVLALPLLLVMPDDARKTIDALGHCWHPYPGQMAPTEICCHCAAKRRKLFVAESPDGCGPSAPNVPRVSGYEGVEDSIEIIPGTMLMRQIGADRWSKRCPGDPPHDGAGEGKD